MKKLILLATVLTAAGFGQALAPDHAAAAPAIASAQLGTAQSGLLMQVRDRRDGNWNRGRHDDHHWRGNDRYRSYGRSRHHDRHHSRHHSRHGCYLGPYGLYCSF